MDKIIQQQTQAYGYALITVLLWSTVASAFKLSLRHLNFVELLFYASLVSTVFLFFLLLASGRLNELKQWSRQDYWRSGWLGLLNPCLYYLVLFKAYALLPAQEAQPLNFTWPIVLVLLSAVVLKQRLTALTLIAMGISFGGVGVIATRGDILAWQITDPLGVTLALGSTLVWSLYWLYGIKDHRDPIVRLWVNFCFGLCYVACYGLTIGAIRFPLPWPGLAGATYVGLFEMGITFVMWIKALKLARTTADVANLIFLSPFLSLIFIHWVVGEPIYPSTLPGLVLIVGGILLQQRYTRHT